MLLIPNAFKPDNILTKDSGLWTRSLYYSPEDGRRLWCTHDRRCGGNRHGRTYACPVLPLAVFPHPGCSPRWITI